MADPESAVPKSPLPVPHAILNGPAHAGRAFPYKSSSHPQTPPIDSLQAPAVANSLAALKSHVPERLGVSQLVTCGTVWRTSSLVDDPEPPRKTRKKAVALNTPFAAVVPSLPRKIAPVASGVLQDFVYGFTLVPPTCARAHALFGFGFPLASYFASVTQTPPELQASSRDLAGWF
ncbi:hypothetical protein DFH29DRAFT_1069217 [Suillus ampliporus]|nr:hypothetical protein DFH29DRAFT_1069217 [Suillus ampliporus]